MSRNGRILTIIITASLLVFLAGLFLGASGISPGELLRALISGDRNSAIVRIFLYVRLPRALAAILAGGALSAAGLLLQSVLRNPLAAPGVIGINSGAGLCVLLCSALLPAMPGLIPYAAFTGSCAAVFAVYLLARLTGAGRMTIVLSGVAVNTLLGACMDAVVTLIPEAVVSRSAFSIGGFAATALHQLGFAAPLIVAALSVTLFFRRELNILSLGDDVAHSLGVNVELFRGLFLLAAAMLSGAAVSFAGLLGFVGLIAPHMTAILCRNDPHLQLPITITFGALLCMVCDLIARTAFSPYELPVGIVLSFLGVPFFLYLLMARRGGSHGRAD